MKKSIYFFIVLVVCGFLWANHSSKALSDVLVQAGNLTYLGSFNVPSKAEVGGTANGAFDYGGTALTYNPINNSLFLIGHPYDNYDAEISIPAIGGTAGVLQKLANPLVGAGGVGSGSAQIGGQLVYNNKLYLSKFLYYDGTGGQTLSHFSRSLNLTSGLTSGPFRVGSSGAGFYSGYMGLVPKEWQEKFGGPALTGNCCLSIISRTSYGPALFSFDPENLGTANPLVYYPQSHQTLGLYGASGKHPLFNGTTRIAGVVFPEGSASVLFFGVTGVGDYCYGEAAACGDPSNNSKGEHAYPYKTYVWAYNANDLAQVKAGTKQPWEVTPYATWDLPQMNGKEGFSASAGYDPKTNKIYLSEKCGLTNCMPRIHVYQLNNLAASTQSLTPAVAPYVAPSIPETSVTTTTPTPIPVTVPTPIPAPTPTTTTVPTPTPTPTITPTTVVPVLPSTITPSIPSPVVSPNIEIGSSVQTLDNLSVRETPGGTKLGFQWKGSKGVVVAGPQSALNLTWWKINFDSGADGWSTEKFLKNVTLSKEETKANILRTIKELQAQLKSLEAKLQNL